MKQNYNCLKVDIPKKNAYSYDILTGSSLLENADEIIKNYTKSKKFLVVTNTTVYEIFKDRLNLSNAIYTILPDGEEYKNFDSLKKILDSAVENKLERKDCIVALGGGVVGDMAGYAAASYMRGIDFIQIPTTLLAQVDSSVGGKVAVNHEKGKNLIGAFYQPKLVLSDITTLKTLNLRQLKTGLAEVLKYAFIENSCNAELQNTSFYEFLKQNKNKIFELDEETITQVIEHCCKLKSAVVNQDETEKGLRAVLNLGHTFAHAIENLTNYTLYTHGEAVAMGMKCIFEIAKNKSVISSDYYEQALSLINDYQIAPEMQDFNKNEFYKEMFLDKKAQDGKIRFVLPNENYKVNITEDVSKEDVMSVL